MSKFKLKKKVKKVVDGKSSDGGADKDTKH